MSTWGLIQIVFDIFAALGLFVVVMRMNRAPKDDPRLSRGLQLLQSKISVLEDLSDRTEVQVNQLTAILEQKAKEVQMKVQLAEQSVNEIRVSTERSLEVAKIFQDKIPHQEIIERQNTIKYVQAARLAHQGLSPSEIAGKVDLPQGEIEFIASVNRERLMFNEEQLPAWAQDSVSGVESTVAYTNSNTGYTSQINAQFADEEQMTEALDAKLPSEAESGHANRLRAEMDLAERQRLVENLSRLQFEMKNLDQQLAKENGNRDLSQAFETPKADRPSLQRLGEEFRRAVENAKQHETRTAASPAPTSLTSSAVARMNQATSAFSNTASQVAANASSMFAPLEHLASLIPEVLNAPSFVNEVPMARSTPPQVQSQTPSQTTGQPKATFQPPPLPPESGRSKIRSALERGNQGFGARPAQETPEELRNARAVAREAMATSAPNERPHHVLSTRQGVNEPVIKKVLFPKIQDGEY